MKPLDRIKKRLDELDGRVVQATIQKEPGKGTVDFRKIANSR